MTTDQKEINFDMDSCMEMMKNMMSQVDNGCDCGKMMSQVAMSQFTEQAEIPVEWKEMMSKMGPCCGIEEQERPAA